MAWSHDGYSRRRFLHATTAASGLALAGASMAAPARAQSFPERTLDVVIPTREGGSADLLFRTFAGVWREHLGADLTPDFYPGASGRVGYEVYINRRDADGYNLLFGNMGPELAVYVIQEPDYSFPEDFQYFCQLDSDPSTVFVRADSGYETIDDVIADAKTRTLNVATSRLPHPSSIGALLLAEHTGAQFNLVPLSGGRNTIAGVVTGEVDIGVLSAGTVAAAGESLRTLLVWADETPIPDRLDQAPTMNAHFGTRFPELVSARAFAVHSSVIEAHPARFEHLMMTAKAAFDDPAWVQAAMSAGQPRELLRYGDREACTAYARGMIELATRYKGLLTGQG